MNRKLAAARALVRNRALPVPERRRDLNQLTVVIICLRVRRASTVLLFHDLSAGMQLHVCRVDCYLSQCRGHLGVDDRP
jgi:hypothetical protein